MARTRRPASADMANTGIVPPKSDEVDFDDAIAEDLNEEMPVLGRESPAEPAFVIEDVAVEAQSRGAKVDFRSVLEAMNIGQSIVIDKAQRQAAMGQANRIAKAKDRQFASRSVDAERVRLGRIK